MPRRRLPLVRPWPWPLEVSRCPPYVDEGDTGKLGKRGILRFCTLYQVPVQVHVQARVKVHVQVYVQVHVQWTHVYCTCKLDLIRPTIRIIHVLYGQGPFNWFRIASV